MITHHPIFLCEYDWETETQKWQSLLLPVVEKTFHFLEIARELEVNILLTNDATLQDLNHRFRNNNKPTNVLSFSNLEEGDDPWLINNEKTPLLLGDIALAYETITEEALKQHKSFDHHLSHLLVHGLLHLLGYDHENEEDATEMENLEVKILSALTIDNPYWSDL